MTRIRTLIRPRIRTLILRGPALAGAILIGCLGGEEDMPTSSYGAPDTVFVVTPSRDSVRAGSDANPSQAEAIHPLYPRLKAGEQWVFTQIQEGYDPSTSTLKIARDSVFGRDSVYIELLSVEVPAFVNSRGDSIRSYSQSGRLFLRKSDQESVHDSVVTRAQVRFAGDSVETAYRLEDVGTSTLTGALPDSLKPGAAWTITAGRRLKEIVSFDEVPYQSYDTTWTDTVDYAVRAPGEVSVRAGTFSVLELRWSTRGQRSSSTGWFAPRARSMVRQIDSGGSWSDTTELRDYLLK